MASCVDDIEVLLSLQDGVIARRQVLGAGQTRTFVARKLRRREWVQVHPGVYINHTGPLTWRQRAWAGVLACWPAALDGRSALRAHEGPGRRGADCSSPIEIVVAYGRHPVQPDGVRVRSSRRFEDAVQANLSPPRLRYDAAVVDLADRAERELDAIAVLADACGARRTTAARLHGELSRLARVRRREWLAAILRDVAEGTCSVLEHGYLTRVERPHGLPRARRQVAAAAPTGRPMFRDVRYEGERPRWRQIVELDGRLDHGSPLARDADLERDLDAALEREHTIRVGYGQVYGRACSTAAKIGRLLQIRGWPGVATPCPDCPIEPHRRGLDQTG